AGLALARLYRPVAAQNRPNPDFLNSFDGKSITNLKLERLFQSGPQPKAHNWAWPQVQDKKGNIWFSSWGGAYRYDGKSFTSFTEKEGIPGVITRIIEDKRGNLWFGGADGLSRYDGKTFTRFTRKEGLANPWVWSILEDKAGYLWVGTRETGLYLYDGKTFATYSEYKQQPARRCYAPESKLRPAALANMSPAKAR
ncbi:ligand-binding sensor domain-containing protein, partial [Hymenobacter saemangeumensis]|uniref:ligand-binding sensor domain-containing protein n=1 Tax=Hymenobacter saemangeumensis TaxID=1084522 RepID=UPI0031EBB24A